MVRVFGAPPQNPNKTFWRCAIQTTQSQVSRNTFAGPPTTMVGVSGAPPQNPHNFFGVVQLKQPNPRYPETPLLAYGVQWYWCSGRHQTIFFGVVQLKHPHPRYPKTLVLAYGVQCYWCLGRHCRTQRIFLGIAQFKHPHPRYPETPLLAHGVQWYCIFGATPEPTLLCSSNTPMPGIQKQFCWPMEYSGRGVWGATAEQTIFFGVVQFKQPHPRSPETPLLAYGVQWYRCLGRHPRSQTIFLALCNSNGPIPGIQKYLCWPM